MKKLLITLLLFSLPASLPASVMASGGYSINDRPWFRVEVGTYTGDGTDNRDIDTGFSPSFLQVYSENNSVWKTNDLSGDNAKEVNTLQDIQSNLIQSIDDTSFQVGSNANINENTTPFYWVGIKTNSPFHYNCNTRTGDGVDGRELNIGFRPDFMSSIADGINNPSLFKTNTLPDGNTDSSVSMSNAEYQDNAWETITDTGVVIGSNSSVNTNANTYYDVLWNGEDDFYKSGTYTGNGVDDRKINGNRFTPSFLMVASDVGVYGAVWTTDMGTGTAYNTGPVASNNDTIQDVFKDGFEIGTNAQVNTNAVRYDWIALKEGQHAINASDRSSQARTINYR